MGVCLALFFCVFAYRGVMADSKVIRIGTGGKTGVYYPVGKLLAFGLTRQYAGKDLFWENGQANDSGIIAVAQNSAGSVENINTILSGETELGLVQADVAFEAYKSLGPFQETPDSENIRAVASLYPEKFQIVVRKDAGIQQVSQLKGKRISLDEQGSGTLTVMRIVMNACGLSEKDLLPVYLKPVFTREKMLAGDLDGFAMMAGVPMEAVSELSRIGVSLVPIKDEFLDKINESYPHLVKGIIPAGIYPGIPRTQTVQVFALLVVHAQMEPALVFKITKGLWSESMGELFAQGHPQASEINLKTALSGLSIPLHQGAAKFYTSAGLSVEGGCLQ